MATVKSKLDEEEGQPLQLGGQAESAPLSGGGQAQGGAAAPNFTKSNFVSGKTILEKNKQAPVVDLTGGVREQAQAQRDTLMKNSAAYDEGLKKQVSSSQLDRNAIEAGAKGDAGQFNRINQLLSSGPNFQNFDAGARGIGVQEVMGLNTAAGVESAMKQKAQKEGRASYTQGQAALDAALFGKSSQGRQQVANAVQEKAALDAEIKRRQDNAAAQKAQAEEDYMRNQRNTRGQLEGLMGEIDKRAKDRVALENSFVDSSNKVGSSANDKATREKAAQIERDIRAGLSKDERDIFNRQNFMLDLLPKYAAAQKVGAEYGEGDVNQFNRIAELLGSSDRREVGGGGRRTVDFDEQGYSDAVQKQFRDIMKQANAKPKDSDSSKKPPTKEELQAANDKRANMTDDKRAFQGQYAMIPGKTKEEKLKNWPAFKKKNARK